VGDPAHGVKYDSVPFHMKVISYCSAHGVSLIVMMYVGWSQH
jgi:hypothetical protein